MKHWLNYIPTWLKTKIKVFVKIGSTRWVLLIGRYAIKFPSLGSYRQFLAGLLGNHQERTLWRKLKNKKMCPVLFVSWGCFILVMPRLRIYTDEEARALHGYMADYIRIDGGVIPVELKSDSFGWMGNRLVAVDYGGNIRPV